MGLGNEQIWVWILTPDSTVNYNISGFEQLRSDRLFCKLTWRLSSHVGSQIKHRMPSSIWLSEKLMHAQYKQVPLKNGNLTMSCVVIRFAVSCNPTFRVTVSIPWENTCKGLNSGPDAQDSYRSWAEPIAEEELALLLDPVLPSVFCLRACRQVGHNNLQQAMRLSCSQ